LGDIGDLETMITLPSFNYLMTLNISNNKHWMINNSKL